MTGSAGSALAAAFGYNSCSRNTRSGASTCGGGASSRVCRTLNMLATAPTPTAVVRAAASETAGFRTKLRTACRTSPMNVSTHPKP